MVKAYETIREFDGIVLSGHDNKVGERFKDNTKLHSKIEQGDQEDSDGGVLSVRRSRADAGNEAL